MSAPAIAPGVLDFDAIGTSWRITTPTPLAPDEQHRIAGTIDGFDRVWSRFRADSEVTRLRERGGAADLGPDAPALLGLLLQLEAATSGAMTPLIGASLEHLGYDAAYRMTSRPGWRPAPRPGGLRLTGRTAELADAAVIDVGSAGKGRLVDLVGEDLRASGRTDYLIDAGRDLLASGEPQLIALEHPFDAARAIGVVRLRDAALCGSGINLRSWDPEDGRGRVHHVLDGRTGRPVQAIAATWVLAPTAMIADALSTALFFVEPDVLRRAAATFGWGWFEYVRMTTTGIVAASPDLPGELFR